MTVVEFQHVKPGKGGAFVRTKLKNFRTGAVLDRTFRADEKVPLAVIDKREMQYLYREGPALVFMDNESYDQLHVEADVLGDAVQYLKEGDTAVLPMYDGEVVGVELPGRGRAHGRRHRAGRAGRPGVGRPQAGDARDRARRAGAAVRRARRDRQGRHPHGRVPRPGLTMATRREARERALGLCYEARGPRRRRRRRCSASSRAPPDPYAERLVRGVDAHREEIDALLRKLLRALGASSACRPSTARCCASAATSSGGSPSSPTAVVINEAVELAKQYSTQGLRSVRRTGCSRASPRSCRAVTPRVRSRWLRPRRRSRRPSRSGEIRTGRRRRRHRQAVDRHRVERPGEPDVVRRVRVPEAVRLLAREGDATDAPGALRGQGRRVVRGHREKAEADVARLHAHGLWATMEHPG